ncbi:MAG: heavy metal-associated domain-containing protein [bacterium]|nr:heavy metal-associated domain-containing protein [bacterium]
MKIQFKITNMTCASCALVNEKNLLKAKGVLSAKVDFASGQAEVEYDEKTIGEQKIKELITKNGYGVI